MNLCCSCIHQNVCEWDCSAYGIDSEFGTKSCEAFRSESDVEMCVEFFSRFMKIWNKKEYPEYLEIDLEELLSEMDIDEDAYKYDDT